MHLSGCHLGLKSCSLLVAQLHLETCSASPLFCEVPYNAVTRLTQVFCISKLSFAFVNLKPVVPGESFYFEMPVF